MSRHRKPRWWYSLPGIFRHLNRSSNRRGLHIRWRGIISMAAAVVMFGFSFTAIVPAFAGGSQNDTKSVAWMMPGSNPSGVVWPQDGATYGHQVPQCTPTGDKKFQVDVYRYDTSAHRAFVDKLLKSATLNRGDDQPVYIPSATFRTPPKCHELKSVTPVKPMATAPSCTNPNEKVTPANMEGVIWNPSGSTALKPGESVTYTATPAAGFKFTNDAQNSWTFKDTFDTAVCLKIVTPVKPMATAPSCTNPNETVTPANMEGVIWNPSGSTALKSGESVAYTATPAAGFKFTNDAQNSWTFKDTFDTKACAPPVTIKPPVKIITPPVKVITPVVHRPALPLGPKTVTDLVGPANSASATSNDQFRNDLILLALLVGGVKLLFARRRRVRVSQRRR